MTATSRGRVATRPRMCLSIRGLQSPGRHVRVDLGGREVRVAKELLHNAEVGAAVEQMRCERVPQGVRRDAHRQPGQAPKAIESVPQPSYPQRRSRAVQEDCDEMRIVILPAIDEHRAAIGEVFLKRGASWTAEEADALLAALSDDPELSATKVERTKVSSGQLADAKAGRICRLNECPVAERERASKLTVVRARRHVAIDGREQPDDLIGLQDSRQPSGQARRRDVPPRVARGEIVPRRPAMKRANRRQPLRHGGSSVTVLKDAEIRAQLRT